MLESSARYGMFVMSSDKTADVARHFAAAFERYATNVECDIFWGTNSGEAPFRALGATPLRADAAGWKAEVLSQLKQLRANRPDTTHAIVFLDDFIVMERVDFGALELMLTDAVRRGVKYLRLAPIEESIVSRLLAAGGPKLSMGGIICTAIRRTHPYYSSLQVAMWDIDYLISCVSTSANLWAFEAQKPDVPHYSVVRPAIRYRHAVEKGAWDHGAGKLCVEHAGFFAPGNREQRTGIAGTIRRHLVRIRFAVAGYGPSRLKRFFLGQPARS